MIKNNKLIIIITIFTLLVIVVGASYAYFVMGGSITDTSNITTVSEDGLSSFSALFNKSDISFPIRLSDMVEGKEGFNGKNTTIGLDISLTSANDNTLTTCNYDIVYTWNKKNTYDISNDYYYRKSLDLENDDKEFTYEIINIEDFKQETQFKDAGDQKEVLMSTSISSSSSLVASKRHYQIDVKFYNIAGKDQNEQKEKEFSGTFSVENINCTYEKRDAIPAAYQQVEYIESHGEEYIDTEYIPSLTTYTKTKSSFNSLNPTTQYIYGSSNVNYSWQGYAVLTYGNPTFWFDYSSYDRNVSEKVVVNTIYEINYYKGAGTINGVSKLSELNTLGYNYNYSLYIFANNSAGSMIYPAKMKLYSMQIYDNKDGKLVRDYVPSYRINDNVVGLYDKIGKKFYTNKGNGAFTKGPNV